MAGGCRARGHALLRESEEKMRIKDRCLAIYVHGKSKRATVTINPGRLTAADNE